MSKSKYEFQRNLAIIIGINDYNNGVPPLQTAVPDAEEFARIMKEQYQYEVHLLLNKDASLEKLQQLIECFNNKEIPFGKDREINKNDRILIYFAGHGIAHDAKEKQEGPVGYLIPQDATENSDTYLRMQDFHDALLKLPCRHLLVILDCCFSGAFYWSSINRDVVPKFKIYKQVYDHYIKYRAWQVITSTSDKQTAVDSSPRGKVAVDSKVHSPFAKYLFEGLNKGADLDNDGIITANDLFNFLRKAVAVETEEYKAQTPGICSLKLHENGEYLFLLQSEPNLEDAPPLDLEKSPYRGLESYEEEHEELYFGRKEQVELLYKKVNNSDNRSLTVVLGASGTGKSSLVKAGLIPYLKKQLMAKSSRQTWRILKPIRLGESPLTALKSSLLEELNFTSHHPGSEQVQTDKPQWFNKILNLFGIGTQPNRLKQTQQLEKEVELLSQNLKNWFNNNSDRTLLLTIDQFEELITLQPRQEEKEQNKKKKSKKKKEEKQKEKTQQELVLKWLPEVMSQYGERLRIILTLRSDFESQFQDSNLKEYWKEEARFHIKEMTTAELREAITEPASKRSIFFVPNTLIDKLVDEVAGMPGTLPLLSFTLNELYRLFVEDINDRDKDKPKDDRAITQEYYTKLGGVARSLTKKAEQEYENLVNQDKAYEQTIRRVMLRMVAVGGGELARRRVLKSELKYPEPENTRVLEVVKTFVEVRLLVEGKNTENEPYVEPAHDALVRGWERLLKWKQEEEENLIFQRRVTLAASEWQEKKRSGRFLQPNDPYLQIVNKERLSRPNWFNQVESEFIKKSIKKKRINTAGLGSLGGLILIAGFLAFLYYRNSEIEQIRSFVQFSETDLSLKQELDALKSSLKAGEKLKYSPLLQLWKPNKQIQNQVRGNLQKAVYRVKERNRLYPKQGQGNFHNVAFSPDNKLLAITQLDGTVSFWDRSGKQLQEYQPFNVGGQISSISFSHDSRQLITVNYETNEKNKETVKTVKWWNLNGKQISPPFQYTSETKEVLLGYNGNLLTVIKGNNKVILRDLEKGSIIAQFESNEPYDQYSPDGKLIATTTSESKIQIKKKENQKLVIAELSEHQFNYNVPVSIKFSPDSKLIATAGSQDDTICLWDLKGNQLAKFKAEQGGVEEISFSPDGKQLATVGKDNTVRIWQNLEGKQIAELKVNSGEISSVNLSSDTYLLAAGSNDGTVRLFNWMKQRGLERFEEQKPVKMQSAIAEIIFNQDNSLLAIGDQKGSLQFWDLENQKNKKNENGRDVSDIGSFNRDHAGSLRWGFSFSQDGNQFAFIDRNNNIKIQSTEQLNNFVSLTPESQEEGNLSDYLQSSAFNLDGSLLASGWLDGLVQVWNLENQKLEIKQPISAHKGQVVSIAFSPKGDLFATAGMDGSIGIARLWNLKGQRLEEFKGHQGLINKVIFSSDGSLLATAGNDGTARVWNLSGQQIAEFKGYVPVESIAFNKDGKQLATVGYTNADITHQPFTSDLQFPYRLLEVKLWQIEDLDQLLARGCEWAKDYLKNSSKVDQDDRKLCDKVPSYGSINATTPTSTNTNNQSKIVAITDRISIGDKILVPVQTPTHPNKQAGVEAIAAGDFKQAITSLTASYGSLIFIEVAKIEDYSRIISAF